MESTNSSPGAAVSAPPGSGQPGRLLHPLCAADPVTLAQVVWRNGPPHWSRLPQMALATAVSVARLPFTAAECAYVRVRRIDRRPMPPPIFIIGHWRSGTTHLCNILCRSPRFGYVPPVATGLPWDFLLLGRWLRPWLNRMLPEGRYIDSMPVHPDSPQEDEAALACMQSISFFHGLYFPRRLAENVMAGVFLDRCTDAQVRRWERRWLYFLRKLTWAQGGRPLVIKNPVYTARVAQVRRLFPEARFIHIHRDPLEVFQSMRRFYDRLLTHFSLQAPYAEGVDELILTVYERMMRRLIEDSADLPADRFVEIDYEQLDTAPMRALAQVYEGLKLEGWEAARPHFEAYLASVRSYRRTRYDMPPGVVSQVRRRWGAVAARWGYA